MVGTATKQASEGLTPTFARHDSFHPRYGWLKKAYDFYDDLSAPDAAVRLGVGKNMVTAIRYWGMACGVLRESGKRGGLKPTTLGDNLFDRGGYDPFLESPATLWLLHWQLLRRPSHATAWYFAFFHFHANSFSSDELLAALMAYRDRHFPAARAADSSLQKDVTCLLRMYAHGSGRAREVPEEALDSPFRELDLIRRGSEAHRFAFHVGAKRSLPPTLIAMACVDFLLQGSSGHEPGARSIGIERLLNDAGAPGRAFKLSESALCDALEAAGSFDPAVRLSEAAGVVQLVVDEDPGVLTGRLLRAVYEGRRAS